MLHSKTQNEKAAAERETVWWSFVAQYTAQIHTHRDADVSQFTVEIFKGTFCNFSYCITDLTRTHCVTDAKHPKLNNVIITLWSRGGSHRQIWTCHTDVALYSQEEEQLVHSRRSHHL